MKRALGRVCLGLGLLLSFGCGEARESETLGSEASRLVAPSQVNGYVVLATGRASFLDRSIVSGGHIGTVATTGDAVTGGIDSKVALGKSTLGTRIVLKDRAQAGDLFATTVVGPLATWASLSPYAAPPVSPPIVAFTPGSTPVTVNTTSTLAAGNYGAVTVNGTLNLSGGIYQIQSLTLGVNAIVQPTAASIVRVAGKVTTGNKVRIAPTGAQGPSALRLIVAGATDATGGVTLGTDAVLTGLVVSTASFTAGDRLTSTGAIAAKNVSTGTDAKITFGVGFECNAAASCNDNNPCTTDTCVDAKCVFTAMPNGTSCPDDGSVCTTDTCSAGVCTHPHLANGTACTSDNNVCTTDQCSAGVCAHPALANGTACTSDNNVCTTDQCSAGTCAHPAVANGTACDTDNNVCTTDQCSAGACAHPAVQNGTACGTDDNVCTSDLCASGTCTHPAVPDGTSCDSDNVICTKDICQTGACSHPNDEDTCATGDNRVEQLIQARWVRADGTPIRSFSYAPLQSLTTFGARAAAAPLAPTRRRLVTTPTTGRNQDVSPFSTLVPDENAPLPRVGRAAQPPVAQSLIPPTEPPQQTKQLQIRNTSKESLGERVAYSVIVRSWGMGNFSVDSLVIAPSAATILDPGASDAPVISLLPNLGIKTPHMAAKADFAVGLHKVDAGDAIDPVPYAYVGVPSFYYNHTDDFSGVYTYGLERPPTGGAPDGEGEQDGLVERYKNGVLGDNMFTPPGFFGDTPADTARAEHLVTFADRGHAVFGMRPSTHDLDASGNLVTPVEPVRPPEGTGGSNEPYDSSKGPTTLCWRWPVSYMDKGSEAYPAVIADAEWNGLVDFIPASFAHADLYKADGTLVAAERLDQNGCMPAEQLGKGNYYFRVFSHDIAHSGTSFEVKAAEPVELPPAGPWKVATRRGFSLTASLYIFDPGRTFFVQNGYWTNTTNVVGMAHHVLNRHFSGIDLGLTANRYKMLVDDLDCDTPANPSPGDDCTDAAFFNVSHFSPTSKTLFIDASADVWTHDSRWKFVAGHELGHQVQDFAGGGLGVSYWYTGNTLNPAGVNDPASALTDTTKLECSCAVVDEANGAHCIQSIETAQSAQEEGFGHFFASRIWNKVPGEAGYDGTCNFTYYKQASSVDLDLSDGPQIFPIYVNCNKVYAHRATRCSSVAIEDAAHHPLVAGSELDWLAFYWDVTGNAPASDPLTVTKLLAMYKNADAEPTTGQINAEQLIAEGSSAELKAFMTDRASAHSVAAP